MENLVNQILDYSAKLREQAPNENPRKVSREEFAFLLGGIASFRRVPGIGQHMGFKELYHCASEEDANLVKEHLQRMYGIEDEDSLLGVCYSTFSGSGEYEQFMTFWKNAPLFDVNQLQPQGRQAFEGCKDKAGYFYPLLQEKGFYAWDISERIVLCRLAVACGIITDEDFYGITDEWVRIAQVFYHSYEEYAISCLCGAIYDMARYEENDLEQFLALNMQIVDILFGENGPWHENDWYEPDEREWVHLVNKDMAHMGCFITKRALEQDFIGYMYREEPDTEHPDSGWRFLYGDEDQAYLDDADNTEIVGLDTVCNLHPDILAYIHAQPGRGFELDVTGWVEEE